MKVRDVVKELLDMPQDAELVICGHEFPGMEDKAWPVVGLDEVSGQYVLIEGAHPNVGETA